MDQASPGQIFERQRYREVLRDQIAQTVSSPEEVEPEILYLIRVLSG